MYQILEALTVILSVGCVLCLASGVLVAVTD